MRSDRIYLAEWVDADDDGAYLNIPWPKVHQLIGNDQIRWIQQQDKDRCQLILDSTDSGLNKLYAEFYDPKLRVEYALRFAK